MPYTEAAILITIVNGVGMPFRILTPMLASRIGTLNTMSLTIICTSLTGFTWLAVTDRTGTYVFTTIYGIFCACAQCLMPTGMASITPRLDKVGTRLGMAFAVASFAGLTGPPLGGAMQAAGGDGFRAAQGWAASVTMVAGLLMAAARFTKTDWAWWAKA